MRGVNDAVREATPQYLEHPDEILPPVLGYSQVPVRPAARVIVNVNVAV